MRILHVNKFLYRRGGAESYMLDLAAHQEAAGDTVAFFAMAHPQNLPSRYEAYFPRQIELEPIPRSFARKVQGAGRVLFSPSSMRGMTAVVREFKPEVVHLHNIYHHLSPSILRPLAAEAIPTVMTLHDYKLACPTYRFLDHGEICEACLGGHFHQAVLRRCNRGSVAASGLNALELALHTWFGAYEPVQLFLCPSRFLAGKMRQAGVFPDRLRHIDLFVETSGVEVKPYPGGPVIFSGRLSAEKGVDLLIHAAGAAGVEVEIAGEGPARQELERLADDIAPGGVRFHGRLPLSKLRDLLRSGGAAVLPSRWYENQPLSLLEAHACGLPVVGSDLGGIPELIEEGVDGYLVPPDDPDSLGQKLRLLADAPADSFAMGRAGRKKVEQRFSAELHLQRVGEAYAEALAAKSTTSA